MNPCSMSILTKINKEGIAIEVPNIPRPWNAFLSTHDEGVLSELRASLEAQAQLCLIGWAYITEEPTRSFRSASSSDSRALFARLATGR